MNRLIHSNSLYLQQHAANPVHWWPWCEEAWNLAKAQNKLVIVSIGYSACHWCHVMEHEVFEDMTCADAMNQDFISIKVDREQHPQVDATFMDALHLMGKQGGWPLNMVVTPEGVPIYGGTYIPKPHWLSMLRDLHQIYHTHPASVDEFAQKIKDALQAYYTQGSSLPSDVWNLLEDVLVKWSRRWDHTSGGDQRAPKFPIADEYMLMIMLASAESREDFSQHAQRTLQRIYAGGIFDAVGGGLSRYCVDEHWHIPHFEKMLYDNARMLGIFAQAYRCFRADEFAWAAREIWDFLSREMKHTNGHFCASIDADSPGGEGAFYVWSQEEWEAICDDNASRWSVVFGIGKHAHWEHGNHVLFRRDSWSKHAESLNMSATELKQAWETQRAKLWEHRNRRQAPAIDQKCVLSWNAILVSSLVDVFSALGDEAYLRQAESLFDVLWQSVKSEGTMSIKTDAQSEELLEDYANLARAALSLFYATGLESWANRAMALVQHACAIFD
ncbi:MAG: thioredoxin domain-containing protein, partial [Flavobacteriales bacterium]